MKLHIAVLPGDGIGPEVVEQALNVTKAVCEKFGHSLEYQTAPVGACAIEETGLYALRCRFVWSHRFAPIRQ